MRILVCGGRDFTDEGAVFKALDALRSKKGIECIISGVARGADTLAIQWAREREIPYQAFPADWKRYPRIAGPIRNQKMLDEGKPDGVVAFPGGNGTADMKRRAIESGLKVWEPR